MGRRGRGALRLLAVAVAAVAALGGARGDEDDGSEPIWTGLFAAVELDDPECVARLTPPPRPPPPPGGRLPQACCAAATSLPVGTAPRAAAACRRLRSSG